MSQGRFTPPLVPEDDWFDEPVWLDEPEEPPAGGEVSYDDFRRRAPEAEPTRERPARGRSRMILVAAALAAVGLLLGGVLAARALTGSDTTESVPTTTDVPTTTATTPVETTTTTAQTTTEETTTETTETTTSPDDDPTASLRPGDEGERVRQLQTDLVALGYSTGGIDGKYGPATEEAVREFQESSGLVVDGIAGQATLAALAEALNG
jgi:cytoskeletal protein RodZ